nr:hypothetical protein BaRGS_008816 [Batillaria attramentaria]
MLLVVVGLSSMMLSSAVVSGDGLVLHSREVRVKVGRAWRVVLDAGFLRVCPIQPHFLRRICLVAGSCPARSHSSSFRSVDV